MLVIVGFIVVIISVVGGYILSHGHLGILFQPFELMIIGGSALGAFLTSTPMKTVKATISGVIGALKGPKYKADDYKNTLSLVYELLNKARRDGFMALEDHVERPQESAIFGNYPKVVADHHLLDFMTDCLRLMIGSNIEPHELEPLLELELEKHHHEAMAPSHALQKVADGLPGFGIVAAVLGIVITMGAIGGSIEEIGHHVAAALVGTFLGILLCYGVVGPVANSIEMQSAAESRYMQCIKEAVVAAARGVNPAIAIEFARRAIFSDERPTGAELDQAFAELKGRS